MLPGYFYAPYNDWGIPPGSYQEWCRGCYMLREGLKQGSILHCSDCMQRSTYDRRTRSSSINATQCIGAEIINDWGTLRCPRELDRSHAPGLPAGSYQASCFECTVRNSHLVCEKCFADDGRTLRSSVSTEKCSAFGFNENTGVDHPPSSHLAYISLGSGTSYLRRLASVHPLHSHPSSNVLFHSTAAPHTP